MDRPPTKIKQPISNYCVLLRLLSLTLLFRSPALSSAKGKSAPSAAALVPDGMGMTGGHLNIEQHSS
jgi:hypothetical protein